MPPPVDILGSLDNVLAEVVEGAPLLNGTSPGGHHGLRQLPRLHRTGGIRRQPQPGYLAQHRHWPHQPGRFQRLHARPAICDIILMWPRPASRRTAAAATWGRITPRRRSMRSPSMASTTALTRMR